MTAQLTIDSLPTAVQRMLARQEIEDVITRYSRAVDRADVELLRTCYHEGATEDHGGTFKGAARDYIDQAATRLPNAGIMTHLATNILVDFLDDATARVETYILTFARMKKDGEKFDTLTVARAVDRFERRDGRWAISARRLCWEWNHEMPCSETWGRGAIVADPCRLVRGAKRPADILYQD